ncbi:unnamed protein product [Staurois parvus]|uniref:Uncharacterized protein n=1 Tax=Staurois parvus TaxID=386267 RepID=A0ABN9H478_9NEOB|nr:unnamed protein product [Staurois parvus]
MEASGGIGREGWRTLNGSQWRDWQRGVEDTEWEASGGIGREGWRTLNGKPVEGLAERGGRYRTID